MNTNELLHTFGLYNAIVVAKDGTRIHWSNALGFVSAIFVAKNGSCVQFNNPQGFVKKVGLPDYPVVDISEYPSIVKAVESFLENFLQKPGRMLTPHQPCPLCADKPDGWVPLADLPSPQ